MIASSNIRALIRGFEGFRDRAYKDGSVYSIGYGNTYYSNGAPVKAGDRITKAAADALLNTVLDQLGRDVEKAVTARINQNQFDALVSLTYNIGIGAFRSSTLLRKVNANPDDPTIRAEFNRWVQAGGVKLDGLVKRRAKEADYYFSRPAASSLAVLAGVGLAVFLIKKTIV